MLAKYFALALVAAGIASAAAAPKPATTTKCAAQAILDKCLQDLGNIESQCLATDYKCRCEGHKNILTCYNNCPNDPQKEIEQSQVTAWCVAAGGGLTTTTTLAAATTSTTETTATGTDVTGIATPTAIGTGTGNAGSKSTTAAGTKTTTGSASPSSTGAGSAVRPMGVVAGAVAAAAWLL